MTCVSVWFRRCWVGRAAAPWPRGVRDLHATRRKLVPWRRQPDSPAREIGYGRTLRKMRHRNALWLFLRREGLRFKQTLFALEQARADVARRRRRWQS